MLGCTMMTVISGVGVRDYYEHLGYSLDTNEDQYMVKGLENVTGNDLHLFGKSYDTNHIRNTIRSGIIVQKYIFKNEGVIRSVGNTYTRIQNGEPQGFIFKGDVPAMRRVAYFPILATILCILILFVCYMLINAINYNY